MHARTRPRHTFHVEQARARRRRIHALGAREAHEPRGFIRFDKAASTFHVEHVMRRGQEQEHAQLPCCVPMRPSRSRGTARSSAREHAQPPCRARACHPHVPRGTEDALERAHHAHHAELPIAPAFHVEHAVNLVREEAGARASPAGRRLHVPRGTGSERRACPCRLARRGHSLPASVFHVERRMA